MSGPLRPSYSFTRRATYKKPYKKSTTGCNACKSRKIKCDEVRPVCGNCKRRFINCSACEYTRDVRPAQSSDFLKLDAGREVAARPASIDRTNVLALRLMHHYTLSTCCSRPVSRNRPMERILWEVDIPCFAFTSEVVLSALLGISAWHLWAQIPHDRTLAIASRCYFGKAIKLQREGLRRQGQNGNNNDGQNAEALFVAGIILAHHSWLLTQTGQNVYEYQLPLETFHLCVGYKTLAKASSSFINPKYAILAEIGQVEQEVQLSSKCHYEFMQTMYQDHNAILAIISDSAGIISEGEQQVYYEVIREIEKICILISNEDSTSTIEYAIVTFLHRVPSFFVPLLEQKEPIAKILFARVMALLALIDDSSSWWIHGTADFRAVQFIVFGIQHLLPESWRWLMDWPLRMVTGDVKL